jgi:hypothetical protein
MRRALQEKLLAESGGIEPLRFISTPRFSRPLAVHSAALSAFVKELVAEKRFELLRREVTGF